MYTIDDFDVYIITHNRCDFLKQTLDSVLHQSICLNKITVLDNESVDDTEQVVAQYKKNNVSYYKTYGQYGNFLKAQELAASGNAKYVMTFHDDDLLHPQFFEKMLLVLNSLDYEPSVLMSTFTWFPTVDMGAPPPIEAQKILPEPYLYPVSLKNNYIVVPDPKEMVRLILYAENPPYDQINPCICSALYRRDCFLKRIPQNDKYGKTDDAPLMIQLSSQGNVVILADRNAVFHRNHAGRDAKNKKSGNTMEQTLAWIKEFADRIDPEDMDSYNKLARMISIFYPIMSSPECLEKHPPELFFKKLITLQILPQNVHFEYKYLHVNITTFKQYLSLKQSSIEHENKKLSFIERIFSVRNERTPSGKKKKVLYILFLKIGLGVKKQSFVRLIKEEKK